MRQGVPGGPEANDQHVFAVVWKLIWAFCVEWIPPRQQTIDLKSEWQLEHVGQRCRFGKRNVYRLLLLKNAALHAVVADTVARAGAHRVVDSDKREASDRVALLLEQVHFRDLFVERAA